MCSILFLSFREVFCGYCGVYCSDVSVYILLCNGVRVCAEVCCVSCMFECGLSLESVNVLV